LKIFEGVIGTIIELNRWNWSNFCCIYTKKINRCK